MTFIKFSKNHCTFLKVSFQKTGFNTRIILFRYIIQIFQEVQEKIHIGYKFFMIIIKSTFFISYRKKNFPNGNKK